ncbi:7-cyano-7-deazaguanine synthase [Phycisphaera mikurensis]|uniref:7-cyano-7-deazaguanine synthase n=1 Tax=Phycisphaera mikurensis (strain NBRC 102666 / KCTC 22515 / FYK2301M01) TaxID=1142394 RepID=I0IH11_PHYMF|nr:7-cyano-7-deazaguanine synthase [Phycisphaera mikurensis]MBB6440804.1 hypothetical protein [Phycisphaera mikurensis]BAM04549.1 hypothetical protein PSMK_23900 [Phycisphaera mikurensis NBRC 102666]
MPPAPRPLLLAAGDLPSLVVLALRHRDRKPMPRLLFVHDGRDASAARLRRLREQMDRYGLGTLEELHAVHLRAERGPGGEAAHPPLADAQLLLAACQAAGRRGSTPVIWATARGDAAGDATAAVPARLAAHETCLLVRRLQEAAGVEPVPVETPLVELHLEQVMALGRRASVDPGLAWACAFRGPAPCGSCDGCRRLRAAVG